MSILIEEWRTVEGREGKNEVSNLGRVRSLDCEYVRYSKSGNPFTQSRRGRILRGVGHSGGYLTVALNGRRREYIHRIVMAAFVGPPSERQDVNHIDGDKTNNRLDNLEYCDRLYNVRHAVATGLQNNAGEGNGMHKYKAEQIVAAHGLVASGVSRADAAKATGVSPATVENVTAGKSWKCLDLPVLT